MEYRSVSVASMIRRGQPMQAFDFSDYDIAELRALQYRVEKELRYRRGNNLQKAREQIFSIARETGLSIEGMLIDIKQKPKKKNRDTASSRYQNPDNVLQKWAGRGRRPRWLAEQIANGKKLDDFRI